MGLWANVFFGLIYHNAIILNEKNINISLVFTIVFVVKCSF
jgi:hypothetical protein